MRCVPALLLLLALPTWAWCANVARFAAQLANGERIEGGELRDWHVNEAEPKLDNTPLIDNNRNQVFRWLRDRSLPLAEAPAAYVEMINGDRLPGTVERFAPAVTNDYEPAPACFLAAPVGLLEGDRDARERVNEKRRGASAEDEVRVIERYVRRIVWQSRGSSRYEPGTIFLRDGRQFTFRAVRFGEDTAYLLLADGQQKAPFRDIAELHLPAADPWRAYYEELAVLTPDLQGRLLQVETTRGVIVTASRERFYCRPGGGEREFERWVHGLQPVWSPDMLWISSQEIAVRRTFAPQAVPLVRVAPTRAVQKSLLAGSGAAAQVNRNVQGAPLACGGNEYVSGFGVQATSELHFPLPACVKAFQTRVGLDRATRTGGCVRARICVNESSAKPLWESNFLQGGQAAVDTGALPLAGPAGGQQELVLYVDPAHEGRPAGADPFDIRDLADWLEPTLELDGPRLASEVARVQGKQVPAWQGWTVQGDFAKVSCVNAWDDARRPGRFLSAFLVGDEPLRLTRELTPRPDDRWFIVSAERLAHSGSRSPRIEIRFNGELVAAGTAPVRNKNGNEQRVFVVPLPVRAEGQAEKRLAVEISQQAESGNAPVCWNAICLNRQRPMLYEVFDETGTLAPVDPAAKATGVITDTDHYRQGARCIKVTAGGACVLKLPEPVAIRERPEWGEYRYLQLALKKKGGGRFGVAFSGTAAGVKTMALDGGPGEPVTAGAKRVGPNVLPAEWTIISCDLFGEFGRVDLEALTLVVPDGEFAEFDAIYLGRTPNDFNDIQPPPFSERQK